MTYRVYTQVNHEPKQMHASVSTKAEALRYVKNLKHAWHSRTLLPLPGNGQADKLKTYIVKEN